MELQYPIQRYNLLCSIFAVGKSDSTDSISKQTPTLIKLEKSKDPYRSRSQRGLPMNLKEAIPILSINVPFLQKELLKAHNTIIFLQNSQKEMKLQFDIRLSLFRNKIKQSQRDITVDENKINQFKIFFINILSDLANLYSISSKINQKQCDTLQENLNQEIEHMITKNENIPTFFLHSDKKFKKYLDSIKMIKNKESVVINDMENSMKLHFSQVISNNASSNGHLFSNNSNKIVTDKNYNRNVGYFKPNLRKIQISKYNLRKINSTSDMMMPNEVL